MHGRLGATERTTIPVQSSDGALGEVFGGVAHVLLCFALLLLLPTAVKMPHAPHSVYRENGFSVELRENPMFAGVKQWSLSVDQDELGEELRLGSHVNLPVVDPAVHHGIPLGFTDTQFGVEADYFDFDGRLGFVEETHR